MALTSVSKAAAPPRTIHQLLQPLQQQSQAPLPLSATIVAWTLTISSARALLEKSNNRLLNIGLPITSRRPRRKQRVTMGGLEMDIQHFAPMLPQNRLFLYLLERRLKPSLLNSITCQLK